MNASLPAFLYEFAYADGRWADQIVSPIPTPRGRARKGQIFVLVDVDGRESPEVAERLGSAVADNFYRDPSGSLTSALVRSIQRVNLELHAENERSIRSERHYATLCCAVFRDDDAYFALAGRGLGYLIRSDHGERFGRGDARPGDRSVELLGQAEEVDVELHHRTLEHPTAIILSSSGLLDLVGDQSEESLRGRPDRVIGGLRAIGREHRGHRPFRTLVMVPVSEASCPGDDARQDPVELSTSWVTAKRDRRDRPRRVPRRVAAPDETFPPDAPGDDAEPLAAPRHPATRPAIRAEAIPRRARSVAWRPHLPDLPYIPFNPSRLALAALLIAVLFFVGYLGVMIAARILQGGAPYTNAMTNLTEAQQRESQAMGQSDPLVRRHLLDEANQLAGQALAARPDDPMTITASARIMREYQAASGIVDLPSPTPVASLPTVGDQMVLNGLDLYVLDRTNSRVYKYLLSPDNTAAQSSNNPILVQEGDHIGPATVGKITAIAWMPASSSWPTASLLALDSSGFLIQYEPVHGLTVLALRDPGSWSSVSAIGGYDGRLYALNPAQQSLASYPSQSSGFDGPVFSYFAPDAAPTLADAVDLAVDGDLYLLHATGQLQRFANGKPVDFAGPPSDLLPSHPSSLTLSGTSIFVGDPAHGRIVQLSRAGAYERELTDAANPAILSQVRDLAISDDDKILYVLSGDQIDRFPLPELQP
ncbi:MAG TPA: hypothetical protein VNL16_02495 [Chloroflexota bacterium]|nr:hypothetical protein [Chloroflexota bacterium]